MEFQNMFKTRYNWTHGLPHLRPILKTGTQTWNASSSKIKERFPLAEGVALPQSAVWGCSLEHHHFSFQRLKPGRHLTQQTSSRPSWQSDMIEHVLFQHGCESY